MEKTVLTFDGVEYILITNKQYEELANPKFIGQTRMKKEEGDPALIYYLMWEQDGVKYTTKNYL